MICSIEWKKRQELRSRLICYEDISLTQDGIPADRWNLSVSLLDTDI